MAEINDRPSIFALSNPTSRAECTAEQAYEWSQRRAIFTSGSPFDEVQNGDKTFKPGQGNNAYIFPGIGLGAVVSGATRISQDMFLSAAKTLADLVSEEDLSVGSIYPPLQNIREVSLQIAMAVAEEAFKSDASDLPQPNNLKQQIKNYMYNPIY